MIMWDEVIESYEKEIKTIPTSFNEEKVTCKTHKLFVFYLRFY